WPVLGDDRPAGRQIVGSELGVIIGLRFLDVVYAGHRPKFVAVLKQLGDARRDCDVHEIVRFDQKIPVRELMARLLIEDMGLSSFAIANDQAASTNWNAHKLVGSEKT